MITEILYIVQQGDTLSRIAQNHHKDYQAIAQQNNLKDPNKIYVDQELQIFKDDGYRKPFTKKELNKPSIVTNEHKAFNEIIRRESNWNPRARNGSHYGLGQLTPANARKHGGYGISAVKSYIAERYGSAVKALQHHDRLGWY